MKSGNKAEFREAHIAEITLYEAARKYLKDAGYLQKRSADVDKIAPATATGSSGSSSDTSPLYLPSIKHLKEQKAELLTRKNTLYEDYTYSRARYRELQTVHQNVHDILDTGKDDHKRNKTTKQEQTL